MGDFAIKVENLSKAYQLGDFSTGTLSRDLERWWALMRGKEDPFLKIGETNDRSVKGESDIIWSLKDINFEINPGDAVGIIGRNGAGKSTLLKVLSRVTSPTTGLIKVKGRIASLLEVGTGFHPDLTGRENVFLNGAILGMRKAEIKRQFDAIVDFADIERYIDTPVKRYSSGMYVRLAFAVAAHLESEILIVDEVLAVGDSEFQKKCLGKMNDVSKGEGRTVLFVSHNMGMISTLCQRAIYLRNGTIEFQDTVEKVLNKYIESNSRSGTFTVSKDEASTGKSNYIQEVYCANDLNEEIFDFRFDQHIYLHIKLIINDFANGLQIGVALDGKLQNRVFTVLRPIEKTNSAELYFILKLPKKLFAPNFYSWTVALWTKDEKYFDVLEDIVPIQIHDSGSELALYEGVNYGNVIIKPIWEK